MTEPELSSSHWEAMPLLNFVSCEVGPRFLEQFSVLGFVRQDSHWISMVKKSISSSISERQLLTWMKLGPSIPFPASLLEGETLIAELKEAPTSMFLALPCPGTWQAWQVLQEAVRERAEWQKKAGTFGPALRSLSLSKPCSTGTFRSKPCGACCLSSLGTWGRREPCPVPKKGFRIPPEPGHWHAWPSA